MYHVVIQLYLLLLLTVQKNKKQNANEQYYIKRTTGTRNTNF